MGFDFDSEVRRRTSSIWIIWRWIRSWINLFRYMRWAGFALSLFQILWIFSRANSSIPSNNFVNILHFTNCFIECCNIFQRIIFVLRLDFVWNRIFCMHFDSWSRKTEMFLSIGQIHEKKCDRMNKSVQKCNWSVSIFEMRGKNPTISSHHQK